MKDKIDELRKERIIFNKIYTNLDAELAQKKEIMKAKIEKTEKAYLEKNFGDFHLNEGKEKAKAERIHYEKEWQELEKKIEDINKIYDYQKFMEESKMADLKKEDQSNFTDLRAEEEKQRKLLEHTMVELMETEQKVNQLKTEANIGSVEEIIKAFKEYENTNANLSKNIKDLDEDVIHTLSNRLKKLN